jgi:hypothetical protein
VNRRRRPVAGLLLAACLTILLAACGEAGPSGQPTTAPNVPASGAPTSTPSPPITPRPTGSGEADPGSGSLVDLGLELRIGALEGPQAEAILEFASDGASVIFSSGVAPDVARDDAAPDLWRLAPGPGAEPELVWRNPDRDHSLVKIGGDLGAYAFVDIPLTGERAWTLWLIPRHETTARRLDEHPGDEDVPSLVPSFSVWENRIAWTAFDRGPDGPVSQLLVAEAPDWTPRVLLERRAALAELWLPALYGDRLAFTEVVYAADRTSDERYVYLMDVTDPGGRRRIDGSGRATMPVIVPDAILWKEADPGFNMFNWGRIFRYDLESGTVRRVNIRPQEYVNYPSGGGRFVAWRGADSFSFGVYDHVLDEPRMIERTGAGTDTSIVRPHVAWDLLVWMRVTGSGPGDVPELRWAFLPDAGDLRR